MLCLFLLESINRYVKAPDMVVLTIRMTFSRKPLILLGTHLRKTTTSAVVFVIILTQFRYDLLLLCEIFWRVLHNIGSKRVRDNFGPSFGRQALEYGVTSRDPRCSTPSDEEPNPPYFVFIPLSPQRRYHLEVRRKRRSKRMGSSYGQESPPFSQW